MTYRRRRNLAWVILFAAVFAAGCLGFFGGRASSTPARPVAPPVVNSAGAATSPVTEPDGSWACPTVADHSDKGAATTAMAGLYSMAVINLSAASSTPAWDDNVTKLLDRYVVAEQRPAMRQYLVRAQSTLTAIAETPVAYQVVSYQPDVAVVRLLLIDYGRKADGSSASSAGVIDATLRWDATASLWRLVSWPTNPDPGAFAALVGDAGEFCHVAG